MYIKNIYTISFIVLFLIALCLASLNKSTIKTNKKSISNSFCNNLKYCSLYNKILFGSGALSKEYQSLFYNTGLGHLLSISGLHLYSLMNISFFILNFILFIFLRSNKKFFIIFKYTYFFSLTVLIFYIFKIDISLPRLRSLIMIFLLMLSYRYYYFQNSMNNLILSGAVIVLLFDYTNLSFYYSYVSCLAISISKRKRIIDISILIFIFLVPVNLFFNGSINLLSLLSNIVFVPFFTYLYFPVLIAYYFFIKVLSIDLGFIIDKLTRFFLLSLEYIQTDYFLVYLGFIDVYKAFLLFFLIIFFYYLFIYKINKAMLVYFCAFIFIIFIIILNFNIKNNYDLKISIFELDKLRKSRASGDFIYLNFKDINLIIDLGYINTKKIFKKLNQKGVKDIDYLILTHDHADHIGGIGYINKYINVKKIIVNPFFNKDLLEHKNYAYACSDTLINFSEEYSLQFINPSCYNKNLSQNQAALGFILKAKNYYYLFFSDIDNQKTIDSIIKKYKIPANKTIVQVPHHCSHLINLNIKPVFGFCTRSKYLVKNMIKSNSYKIYSTAYYGDINIIQKDENITVLY